MKKSKRWQYYQPNKKDLKDKYGDCVIRAFSKAAVTQHRMRGERPTDTAGIHHPQIHTCARTQRVDRSPSLQKILHHLTGDCLWKGGYPPDGHTMVCGHGQHQGRADQ